jgi:hypothetical protein
LLVVHQFPDACLEVAPQLRAPVGGFQPQGQCQTAVDVNPAEFCFWQIY